MKKRKRNRLENFDYSRDALYYITSCTQGRIHYFGEVNNEEMKTNKFGQIAKKQWYWLGERFLFVILHAFVVMPDHIHGIIEINRNNIVRPGRDLAKQPKIKPLSQLIGAYKTTVSKQIHLIGGKDFAWQRSFHDHIIRN
ncbi:MAG: hypothetical protein KAT48_03195, partial [Bacteroidales bacterium]|nr:hypothetical protein [Bacteroidales bacterium]